MSLLTGKNYIVIPKSTTVERLALTAVNGMLVYDTDLNKFYFREGGAWVDKGGGGGSVSWGGIGGTLSNQTDLQSALNAKQTIPFAQAVNTSVNIASTSAVQIMTKSLTGLAVGDVVQLRIVGNLINNSGSARTYTHILQFGSLTLTIVDGQNLATSATNEAVHEIEATIMITATDFTAISGELDRGVPSAIDTGQSITVNSIRKSWNESTSDLTGTQTLTYSILSTSNAATQTFKLRASIITILKSNP